MERAVEGPSEKKRRALESADSQELECKRRSHAVRQPAAEGEDRYGGARNNQPGSSEPSFEKNEPPALNESPRISGDPAEGPGGNAWDGKRRIIIWCHEEPCPAQKLVQIGRQFVKKAPDSCTKRAKELNNIITKYESERYHWRPHFYFLRLARKIASIHEQRGTLAWTITQLVYEHGRKDTCKQAFENHLNPLWNETKNAKELEGVQLSKLSPTRLETLLRDYLLTLPRNLETIMIMTKVTKESFKDFVYALTRETVECNEQPYVALLESTKTETETENERRSWRQNCSLSTGDWKLEKGLGCHQPSTRAQKKAPGPVTPAKEELPREMKRKRSKP